MVVEAFRAASAASGPKESAEWDGPALAAAATRLEGVCSALKKLARAEAPPRATTHPRVSPRGSTSSKGGAAGSTARSPLQPIDSAHSGANAKTTDSAEGATASLRQEPTGGAPTMPQARDADAAAAQDADAAAAQDADAAAAPAAPPKPAAVAAAVPPAATPPDVCTLDASIAQQRARLQTERCRPSATPRPNLVSLCYIGAVGAGAEAAVRAPLLTRGGALGGAGRYEVRRHRDRGRRSSGLCRAKRRRRRRGACRRCWGSSDRSRVWLASNGASGRGQRGWRRALPPSRFARAALCLVAHAFAAPG